MYDALQHLLAQQATPLELIYFILTVCALAILGAAIIYALVMSALWALRLRPTVRYHRVFLPTRAHLRAFLPEYLFAFATTAILTVTIAVKHDIVDQVLEYPVADLQAGTVERLMPLGALPEEGELAGLGERAGEVGQLLRGEAERSTPVVALGLLKPFLEAGRTDEVRRVVGVIVEDVTESARTERALLRALLIASVVMILAYLAWLARGRFTTLRASPDAPVTYRETSRRVAMMGIALALILASGGMVDPEIVAESAMSSLRHEEPAPEDRVLADAIHVAVDRQHAMHRPLLAFAGITNTDSVGALLAGLGMRLGTTEGRLTAAEGRVAATDEAIRRVGTELSSHESGAGAHRAEFERLLGELASQSDRLVALERGIQQVERAATLALARAARIDSLFGGVRTSLASHERGLDELDQRFERLAGALRALRQETNGREILLVSTSGEYSITGGGAQPDSGVRLGVHLLPTGVEHVVRAAGQTRRITLQAGEPRTEAIFPPNVVQP